MKSPRVFGSLLTLSFTFALATSAALAGSYEGLALPFREVEVSSPVPGQVVELAVREGGTVEEGALVARLFSRVEELNMNRAKAALEKREFDYRSSQNLFEDKLVSEDDALTKRIELDLAKLEFEIAQEQFLLRQIKAPLDGVVVERKVEVGETVTANQPVFVLVDIDRIYVQFYAPAEDLPHLREGLDARVQFPELGGAQVFAGKIDFIDPRVDAASGLLRVRVLLENPEHRIKAGLRAEIELES